MRPRPKGVVTYRSPENPAIKEAEANQRQERLRLQTERAERRERPVPNWKCYPMVFKVGVNIDENGNWLGGKLPRCRVCEERLDPKENHVCPGFTPKYVEHDEEWRERKEAKREAIREARFDPERLMGLRHARMEMIREARLNGELYGIEEDYCEGEDDGYECEDDGVYGDDDGCDCE